MITSFQTLHNLWTEKYRPQVLAFLVASAQLKAHFEIVRKTQVLQNTLLIGRPGCGKTTLAKIIVNDILKCTYLYINASDENGIDTIRTKIANFIMTKSLDGRIKVVILDEADGVTGSAQRALRNLMEEYSQYARFILTGNEKHKIIPALQSRCESFELEYTLKDVAEYCKYILEQENITLETPEQKKAFCEIIRDNSGDIRKTINSLQKHCSTGEFIVLTDDNSSIDNIITNVFQFITNNDAISVRKYTIENENSFNNDYQSLLKRLLEYVFDSETIQQPIKVKYSTIICEHIYRSNIVADQEINWFSCVLQLCS